MGSSKPKDPPPPAPIPKEENTMEAVDQTLSDQRRLRRGFLTSVQAGETGMGASGGNSFLG